MSRLVQVRIYKGNTGQRCLHCGAPAKVLAFRVKHKLKLPVRYCMAHYEEAKTRYTR